MKEIENLIKRYENNIKFYAGYPHNLDFDYKELFAALAYPINNYGDPFLLQNPVSSHEYEIEVIKWFLKLYGIDETCGWGYVTTGGTEGILFGIWRAKEFLNKPILYFSDYAHYSVMKSARITSIEYRIIKSSAKGEIDYDDFNKQLVLNRDAIILATLGNTITSAIDDINIIRSICDEKK